MMETLADLTTLGVGGKIKNYIKATTEDEIIKAVSEADASGDNVLVVGGGSNILAGDTEFDGTVVHIANVGYDVDGSVACDIDHNGEHIPAKCGGYTVKVAAGHNWDEFVSQMIQEGLYGVEVLSGIPGTVGATPIQNVGAYGGDVSQTISRVYTWDRKENKKVSFANADMKFSYRDSIFKQNLMGSTPRYVVLAIEFQFMAGNLSFPIKYAELARSLGVEVGDKAPTNEVRDHVLKLRASKGMVLDSKDRDTYSTGSFFTNPIVDETFTKKLPEGAPAFPAGIDGKVKLSAAWLIGNSGFEKGYGLPGVASLSTKHTLAITNRGDAKTADVLKIAGEVIAGVQKKFDIKLEPEPILVNCQL
ncbi:MAG: UDP-N-acetylmuramate dehydrogenase [Micrococcaceae bacterium]